MKKFLFQNDTVRIIFLATTGIILGAFIGFAGLWYLPLLKTDGSGFIQNPFAQPRKQIIGFLPYWLLSDAKADYSPYITTLTYFGLSVDQDGHVVRYTNPGESDPGWYSLTSGRVDPFLNNAKKHNVSLSLLVSSGDPTAIDQMITNPRQSAKNLVTDVVPIMKEKKFTDLNLDIERVGEASESARQNFTTFVKTVKETLTQEIPATVTVEITATDLIKQDVIDPTAVAPFADYIVIMAYDYHYTGSYVTGPISPLNGVGKDTEYDVATAVKVAKQTIPDEKIILGIPLYGYEWETIGTSPRSAIVPGSGLTASNKRVEELLNKCGSCSVQFDAEAQESYLVFPDPTTGTYHQIFYPDAGATHEKINFVEEQNLEGVALWALGYEGRTIMEPLKDYRNIIQR